ncbi:preprotein translocase subunit SecG [Clostridium amylolyticum]|uniref:Protein-export membrane protein SecG n=1 Tax=Clostridium amylolyticum TaxID=1121298 RepID=A0A1M6JB94_9CLOT|nr:preprotein translocase subunit SecG [Clostridium amylolyticum]SHJ43950.1 preprotein translocase subunit SecG [Clostridium amylolyticum]
MRMALFVLEVILSIVLIVSVLMQPSKSDGLRGLMQGTTETFFSKNKKRTREAALYRVTIVSAILFAINTLALNLVK